MKWVQGGKKFINYGTNGNDSANTSGADQSNNTNSKLTLNARLKEVLSTQFMMSDADVDHICNEASKVN